jgi:hypothetical protein
MPKSGSDEKANSPASPAAQPKPQPGKATDDSPVHTEPNKPNDEVVDPRAPG